MIWLAGLFMIHQLKPFAKRIIPGFVDPCFIFIFEIFAFLLLPYHEGES
jgi:hypothetical protein